jgi:hypothetical protein
VGWVMLMMWTSWGRGGCLGRVALALVMVGSPAARASRSAGFLGNFPTPPPDRPASRSSTAAPTWAHRPPATASTGEQANWATASGQPTGGDRAGGRTAGKACQQTNTQASRQHHGTGQPASRPAPPPPPSQPAPTGPASQPAPAGQPKARPAEPVASPQGTPQWLAVLYIQTLRVELAPVFGPEASSGLSWLWPQALAGSAPQAAGSARGRLAGVLRSAGGPALAGLLANAGLLAAGPRSRRDEGWCAGLSGRQSEGLLWGLLRPRSPTCKGGAKECSPASSQ